LEVLEMARRIMSGIGALAMAVLIATAAVAAEPQTGLVQGRVIDEQEHPLAGVLVSVTSSALPRPIEGRTTSDGRFVIKLPDITLAYQISFELAGYQGVTHEVDVERMQHASLEVRLPKAAPAGSRSKNADVEESNPANEQRHAAITLFNDGVAALKADDVETANAKFHEAMEADPEFPEPYRALAATAAEAEDWSAAASYAEQLLRFEPDNLQAMTTVYYGRLMVGDVDATRSAAARLVGADPESLPHVLDHANTFYSNNDFPMARALLEVYTAADPTPPDPWFSLGVSANALGDGEAARAAFARFLELAPPDHPDRTTAQEILDYLK
jgi:tetratricopeptide (TPR) repeat protein